MIFNNFAFSKQTPMTNSTFCDTCSHRIHASLENISDTMKIWEMEYSPDNPSEEFPVPRPTPGHPISPNSWLEESVYHGRVLPIAMPLLIVVAVVNNALVLAVTALSPSFRRRTFASTRLLIGSLACCDFGIILFARVPLIIGPHTYYVTQVIES